VRRISKHIFRDASIQRKLTLIIMLTSSAVLLLACMAFVTYELVTFRGAMVRELSTLAEIIGANSTAALAFDDQRSAEETLAALSAKQRIVGAYIYTKDGVAFARYHRAGLQGDFVPPEPRGDSYRFAGDHLALFRRITLDDEMIGTVYIQSDLQEMQFRLQRYTGIVAGVMLASFCVAFVLSSKLQRVISEPILQLTKIARVVSAERNYAIRAVKHSDDELGFLIEGFNEMLTQIQERDAALQSAHDELEKRVEQRTKALQEEIIERERVEREIQRLNEELEQRVLHRTAQLEAANKELEAFAYSVSHDLRAPLRSIDGFSQVLLKNCLDKLDARGQHYLQRVRAASQRMGELIDDLLSLSRVTRMELSHETVDLSALARTIAAELRETQPHRQVEFVIADGLTVQGDKRLLRVVLENLLGNAWKFTSAHPRARIEFATVQQGGKQVYVVRDDGVGFDMAYAEKLFRPFQRLHAVDEFEGTGIGLATVQRIIHRHGGHIWAEGAVDQGASIYFTL
jgi:signal transduction histidine kinase